MRAQPLLQTTNVHKSYLIHSDEYCYLQHDSISTHLIRSFDVANRPASLALMPESRTCARQVTMRSSFPKGTVPSPTVARNTSQIDVRAIGLGLEESLVAFEFLPPFTI